jgi:hypothetical protein
MQTLILFEEEAVEAGAILVSPGLWLNHSVHCLGFRKQETGALFEIAWNKSNNRKVLLV